MLTLSLFRDSFRPGWIHLNMLILKFLVTLIPLWNHPDLDLFESYGPEVVPALLPGMLFSLALIFHSMIVAFEQRESDLVESRRRLRPWFILLTGSLLLLGIIGFLILKPLGYGSQIDALTALWNFIICLAFISGALDLPELLLTEKKAVQSYKSDPEVAERIIQAFEIDKIHRRDGLTVRDLAQATGLQEYRVRRQINGQMGYRNFNDLLNKYRIQEACEILNDPGQRDTPVIRIAMDVGYPSPGPFNRAFRAIVGTTPSEYRRKSV
jgi:AraC-like DNA-binding protein